MLPTGRGALTDVLAARGFDKQNQAQGVLSAVQAGAPWQTLSFTMKVSPFLDFTLNCPFAGSITTVTLH